MFLQELVGGPLHYGTMFSVCGASRSVPPPLPSCAPVSEFHERKFGF